MLHRIGIVWLRVCAALTLFLVPALAFAQALAGAPPESVQVPTDWKSALWSLVLLPLATWLWAQLNGWAAARRQQAQAAADSSSRAYVEEILFRLVDAVGAPAVADLRPIFARVTDPASEGGAAITRKEWDELYAAIEAELRETLTPDKLKLVAKVIGIPAAVRLIATALLRRAFAVRQSAANPTVATDSGIVLYAGRDGEEQEDRPAELDRDGTDKG
jgi:hypothetical protein